MHASCMRLWAARNASTAAMNAGLTELLKAGLSVVLQACSAISLHDLSQIDMLCQRTVAGGVL